MAYSKLHSSIVNSSLWTQPDSVRILFVTLLAMCDMDGVVYGSREGLARIAFIDPDQVDSAWEALMAPDADSSDSIRAPEHEGRRVERVSGGFRLLNFEYYRGLRNDDDRRKQNREAQARFREKSKPASAKVSRAKPPKAHTETDTEAEAEAEAKEHGRDSHISTALSTDEQIDGLRKDIETEEKALLRHLVALQAVGEDVQAVCDSLDRPKGQAAFNANRALLGGRSGIPETPVGLTVRRRLIDALEARQRAQTAPYISERNRVSFDSIDRVLGTGAFSEARKPITGSVK